MFGFTVTFAVVPVMVQLVLCCALADVGEHAAHRDDAVTVRVPAPGRDVDADLRVHVPHRLRVRVGCVGDTFHGGDRDR